MHGNSPTLETRIGMRISLEDLEGYVLSPQALGQAEPANTGSDNQNVYRGVATNLGMNYESNKSLLEYFQI